MLYMMQITPDPPTTFYALSWIALGAMAAALVYIFRAWQTDKRNCVKQYQDIIKELLAAAEERSEESVKTPK